MKHNITMLIINACVMLQSIYYIYTGLVTNEHSIYLGFASIYFVVYAFLDYVHILFEIKNSGINNEVTSFWKGFIKDLIIKVLTPSGNTDEHKQYGYNSTNKSSAFLTTAEKTRVHEIVREAEHARKWYKDR